MKKKIEDIQPGETIFYEKRPWVVTRHEFYIGGSQNQNQMWHILHVQRENPPYGSTATKLNGWAGTQVDVIPPKPTFGFTWNQAEDRYDIALEVEGTVEVRVNGELVYGGLIKASSQRTDAPAELSA